MADHDLALDDGSLDGGIVAVCSCGWDGDQHDNTEDAVEEWENHCDVVFMEATMKGGD